VILNLKNAVMEPGYYNEEINSIHFGAYPAMNVAVRPKRDITFLEDNEDAPLSIACSQGRFELVKQLIENGSDINQKDQSNLTPIMRAATSGHKNIVELLVSNGAKISYSLLCSVKTKIDILEEDAKEGKEDPYAVACWKNFLDYLIQEGKKQ
jgi:ankyrin repeat protein